MEVPVVRSRGVHRSGSDSARYTSAFLVGAALPLVFAASLVGGVRSAAALTPLSGTPPSATITPTSRPTSTRAVTPCPTGTPCPPGQLKNCPLGAPLDDSCLCRCVAPTVAPTEEPTTPATPTPFVQPLFAEGGPGQTVPVDFILQNAATLAALVVDSVFDASTGVDVVSGDDGAPDCTINAAIGAGSAADKILTASLPASPSTARVLDVEITDAGDVAHLLPPGVLFTCNFHIALDAPQGFAYQKPSAQGTDANGDPVGVAGYGGYIYVLNVTTTPTGVPTYTPTPLSGTPPGQTVSATRTSSPTPTPTACATGTPCPGDASLVCQPGAVIGDTCRCTCAQFTLTPVPPPTCGPIEAHLEFQFMVDPPQPVAGDTVTLTVEVRTTAGPAFVPVYTLRGADPIFTGDTESRSYPHLMSTTDVHTVVYTLQAVQAGTAMLQFIADYEKCTGCTTCEAYSFTQASTEFAVTVSEVAGVSPTATPTPSRTRSLSPTPCATGTPCPPGSQLDCEPGAEGDPCRCTCAFFSPTPTETPECQDACDGRPCRVPGSGAAGNCLLHGDTCACVGEVTPTASPTQRVECTPPLCAGGEVYYCEGTCQGGCGVICVTPTATASGTVPAPSASPSGSRSPTKSATPAPSASPSPSALAPPTSAGSSGCAIGSRTPAATAPWGIALLIALALRRRRIRERPSRGELKERHAKAPQTLVERPRDQALGRRDLDRRCSPRQRGT
jgi:hypothetical protein